MSSLRQEITWGDVTKLLTVIGTLAPANKAELLSGFGVGLPGPRHLQTVRNAAAHMTGENLADVRRLMNFYFGPSLKHPTDIAMWTVLNAQDPAYIAWVSELRTMAATAAL